MANLLEVRMGRKTWDQSVVEAGPRPRQAASHGNYRIQQSSGATAGIILDIDPRNVDRQRGAYQIKQTEAISDGSAKEAWRRRRKNRSGTSNGMRATIEPAALARGRGRHGSG